MVSLADFLRFLGGAQKAQYSCNFCGNRTFNTLGASDISLPGVFKLSPDSLPATHPFLGITCTNCGRADFFHENQIHSWLAAHPAGTT